MLKTNSFHVLLPAARRHNLALGFYQDGGHYQHHGSSRSYGSLALHECSCVAYFCCHIFLNQTKCENLKSTHFHKTHTHTSYHKFASVEAVPEDQSESGLVYNPWEDSWVQWPEKVVIMGLPHWWSEKSGFFSQNEQLGVAHDLLKMLSTSCLCLKGCLRWIFRGVADVFKLFQKRLKTCQ